MLVLLPPSETKATPASGPGLDITALSAPTLTVHREHVIDALIRLCRGPQARALAALGLSARMLAEVERNAGLREAPCAPAIEVYTGVLYDALDVYSLTTRARQRVEQSVHVQSALFGVVGAGDSIPAYRLSADSALPRLGVMARWWSTRLAPVMRDRASDDLVVDLRSAAYAALWRPQGDVAARTVTLRVLTEVAGRRTVVSHHNKATKGRIVRALANARSTPRDADSLADVVARMDLDVELHSTGAGWRLDVIVDQP